jgi:glycosyltransferase involved in cell wall biosynthesis/rhamnogalacturonyl hydrolase YesR
MLRTANYYRSNRVAMITHSVYTSDNRVRRYAESLAARGDRVEVFAIGQREDASSHETINGVHVFHVQRRAVKSERSKLAYLWPLLRFLALASIRLTSRHFRQPYDIVHVHNIPDFLVFAAWYPKLTGVPVILDIHDIVPELFASKFQTGLTGIASRLLLWMERASGAFADRVIIANHLWLEKYAQRTGLTGRCTVFINHVDAKLFRCIPRTRQNSQQIVLYPGGLQWHQGLDIALRAFKQVVKDVPAAEFHIYGDGSAKRSLVRLADDLGLNDRVRFFQPRTAQEIATIMANADVGVVPKRADSFGDEAYSTKIMEFMAVGVPVIVSSTKVDRYYFNDLIVRFFESGNADALAREMVTVLRNDELRRSMTAHASAYAATHCWENRKGDYLRLVDSLCARADERQNAFIKPTNAPGSVQRHLPSATALKSVAESLNRVQQWVEARDYKGYDPADGLTSWLRPLTLRNVFAERVLQQVIWKAPWNLRRLAGIKRLDSSKGRGFMAGGYLLRFRRTGDSAFRHKAVKCLDWLIANKSPKYPDYCWGNHFDFTTRAGRIPAQEPTIVWSGLIGQAFLEAYEQLGDRQYLAVAESICNWILKLPREQTPVGSCISYHGLFQSSIHNSNLLGAALLARTWKHTRRKELLSVAGDAMRYSCHHQLPNGAWWYGEQQKYHWIDNFHTGYNLDSIRGYIEATGDDMFRNNLRRGYRYFVETFFEPSGCPRYYHNKTYPIDIQSAAQSIDTLCLLSDEFPESLDLAANVARWTISNFLDESGYFYYRKYPLVMSRTPYFHWGQATMFKALAHFVLVTAARSEQETEHREPAGLRGDCDCVGSEKLFRSAMVH